MVNYSPAACFKVLCHHDQSNVVNIDVLFLLGINYLAELIFVLMESSAALRQRMSIDAYTGMVLTPSRVLDMCTADLLREL